MKGLLYKKETKHRRDQGNDQQSNYIKIDSMHWKESNLKGKQAH